MITSLRWPLATGVVAVSVLLVTRTFAQSPLPYLSQSPIPYQGQNTGRYQMLFSPFARADSFLVDTQTGEIRQMVKASNGNVVFELVRIENAPLPSNTPGRYRIYFGSQARADTFLLDTASGNVWQMFEDTDTKMTFFRRRTVQRSKPAQRPLEDYVPGGEG